MTHVRVACPPRGVAMRFALARAATVSMVVTLRGRTVARPGARLGAGSHVLRFRVQHTGQYLGAADRRGGPGAVRPRPGPGERQPLLGEPSHPGRGGPGARDVTRCG